MIFNHLFIGIIAVLSLAIILIQLVLTVFGGIGDVDVDGDFDFDASIFLSPKGILHFLAGSSWYLVLIQKETLGFWDYMIAILVGLVAAFFIGLLYYSMSKLTKEVKEEKGEALVGKQVEIYLKTGKNQYDAYVIKNDAKILISVQTKKKSDLSVGSAHTIVSYENGIYYIN